MVTRHNEEKYGIAGRFRTLKRVKSTNMTEISNSVYIDKLDDMINEYNKAYRTIKMKLNDVKTSTYVDVEVQRGYKDAKFEVGGHVRTSKYKNIFSKVYALNCSEEDFLIKKVKNTVS